MDVVECIEPNSQLSGAICIHCSCTYFAIPQLFDDLHVASLVDAYLVAINITIPWNTRSSLKYYRIQLQRWKTKRNIQSMKILYFFFKEHLNQDHRQFSVIFFNWDIDYLFFCFSAMAHREIIHNSKEPTFYTKNDLLGQYVRANDAKTHYLNQLVKERLA